jgi:hypothetical protein
MDSRINELHQSMLSVSSRVRSLETQTTELNTPAKLWISETPDNQITYNTI